MGMGHVEGKRKKTEDEGRRGKSVKGEKRKELRGGAE